ncbi:MAG: hypothetical protein ABIK43_00275 [candidate division WOR-3 bacterium]
MRNRAGRGVAGDVAESAGTTVSGQLVRGDTGCRGTVQQGTEPGLAGEVIGDSKAESVRAGEAVGGTVQGTVAGSGFELY